MRKEFFSALHALVGLSFALQDQYLVSKLKTKSEQILFAFLDLVHPTDVAQSRKGTVELTRSLTEVTELIDLMVHLKLVPLSPALDTKKHLMALELKMLNSNSQPANVEKISFKKESVVNTSPAKTKSKAEKNDAEPEERILGLIRQRGKCQTREIIYAFKNEFSPRTIQRYLQQLMQSGKVIKELEEGYPKYSIKTI
ncbi:MAG: hypothetical protein Q7S32_04585 [bacterium]|nr:hypothetical protein [bacterium]